MTELNGIRRPGGDWEAGGRPLFGGMDERKRERLKAAFQAGLFPSAQPENRVGDVRTGATPALPGVAG